MSAPSTLFFPTVTVRTFRAANVRRILCVFPAYTTAFANFANLKKYYIDDLSGAGSHISRTTKARIEGESSA